MTITKPSHQLSALRTLSVLLWLLSALACSDHVDAPVEASHVPKAPLDLALEGHWSEVVARLASVSAKSGTATERMLKAHACLAMNRNNESFALHLSLSDEDLLSWLEEAEQVALKHPKNAIAHYLYGDSLAKAGRLEEAEGALSRSVQLDPESGLAWNAQGLVSVMAEKHEEARQQFRKASELSTELADPWCNQGMTLIGMAQGRRGATSAFQTAIQIDPEFATAHHGLGCLELLAGREDSEHFDKAMQLLPEAQPIFLVNETRYYAAQVERQSEEMFADAGELATSLQKTFEARQFASRASDFRNRADQATNPISKAFHSARAGMMQDRLVGAARKMDVADMRSLQQTDSRAFGQMLNSLSGARNRANTLDNASKALSLTDRAIAYGRDLMPGGSLANRIGSDASDLSRSMTTNLKNDIGGAFDRAISVADTSIRRQIETGTYTPPAIPTPQGVSRGVPGNRSSINNLVPQGATTDQALVNWDEGSWPFEPIFGLMYASAENPSDLEREQK
ncbi:MAG: hypothetical protein DWQ01_09880 [Planctomycetota bacterium]|nr:MAG: hypothetical protein DWQ01_09880 [Planctomycetota bacterium]